MENIAPEITRQRLLIEGFYTNEIAQPDVDKYLTTIATELNLRFYGKPVVHAPGREGKDVNDGFDAFLPLIDSGISLYVWTNRKFFAVVVFTCKAFNVEKALESTQNYFGASKLVSKEF